MEKSKIRKLIINFIIELVIYGILVVAYFYLVLRYLRLFLTDLYHDNLVIYAIIGLILIVVQAVVLEAVTSFLLDRLRLERLE
ncbi:MAG: hypothetical protein MUO67_19325 [Anaerolineales bacterium]|jgi:hypothetical protein|nr:hypothetical protein [Anaerolineales bacterium]